ncbi:Uncharacterised protein [Campylobacter jejuni subsp. doylei]|uniref:Uncharacterized protein n=1 Tax=Campylobacter jejuni subsp. doylei TaxID=32021 RepID=A0A3S4S5M8_CAMJU|nr:Uncharacterised protein [Campylobacter jejuni subsp. doylei]
MDFLHSNYDWISILLLLGIVTIQGIKIKKLEDKIK